ncbi:hypothetical protein KC960_02440 [Candidatus Saccharibacteria bacterium]|nr:hypothetical protein [Candidatus Saccharibacteria bacterium]
MGKSKNVFNEKGSAAEALIADLCGDAFFQDFCFKNPYVGTGKGRKELCDVLVVLGDTAIVWQIKNIKLGRDGVFKQGDVNKAISQCRGAKRKINTLGKITLTNISGKAKVIDATTIKNVYLIAAIEGGLAEMGSFYDDSDRGNVHIFFEKFTRYATKHLNTVKDFIRYLQNKERFLSDGKGLVLSGGEEELLAVYINNNRTFGNMEDTNAHQIFLDTEGSAAELEEDDGYKTKQELDNYWGKAWDELIRKKSEGLPQEGDISKPEDRDKFLAKMMSHDRFERRILGKTYADAAVEAAKGPDDETFVYRRYYPLEGVTYVFAFMGNLDGDKRPRQTMLYLAALAARKKFPQNNMVIAVVSERAMVKNSNGCSFDWVLLDATDEDLKEAITPEIAEFMDKHGYLKDPKIEAVTAYEYPEDIPHKKDDS